MSTTPRSVDAEQRIADLERALRHERAVSAAERRRADRLEDATRRAYAAMAVGVRPVRRDVTETD